MKKLLGSLAVALLVSCAPAYASERESLCTTLYEYAHVTMYNRQHGVALKTTLDRRIKPTNSEERKIREVLDAIIQDAYSVPLFRTKEAKEIATNEFATNVYLSCVDITESENKPVAKTLKEYF